MLGRNDHFPPLQSGLKPWYLVVRFLIMAGGRSIWRALKNCIKVCLGREAYFDEDALFLQQYLLHLLGIRPIHEVTCTGLRGEGAGSQALMIMNAINFARSFGLVYEHTPFSTIAHADRPMKEWAAAWEAFFNLGAGERVCSKRHDAVNFCYTFMDLDVCFGWGCRDRDLADRFKAMIPELQYKYGLNKSPHESNKVTVAVHVRRGDVSSNDPDYFTSNEIVLRTMTEVRSVLDTHKIEYTMVLYSEGTETEFADLSLPGVEFFLNKDALRTMQELIEADVLIMAKGCFSYCAGLLSNGIKIFQAQALSGEECLLGWKWQYVPLSDSWIPCQAEGSFDRVAFERQLLSFIQAKTTSKADRVPNQEKWT